MTDRRVDRVTEDHADAVTGASKNASNIFMVGWSGVCVAHYYLFFHDQWLLGGKEVGLAFSVFTHFLLFPSLVRTYHDRRSSSTTAVMVIRRRVCICICLSSTTITEK